MLMISFEEFSQVFSMRVLRGVYIERVYVDDDFLSNPHQKFVSFTSLGAEFVFKLLFVIV
jgi:hypothetical protein